MEIKPFVQQDVEFVLIGTEQFQYFDRPKASTYASRVKAAANPHDEVGNLLKEAFEFGSQTFPGKSQAGLLIFFHSPSQQKIKMIKKYIDIVSNEKQPPQITDENVKPSTHPNIQQTACASGDGLTEKLKKLTMQPVIAETIDCCDSLRLGPKQPPVSGRKEILIQHTLFLDDL